MRRTMGILCVAALVLSWAGCGRSGDSPSSTESPADTLAGGRADLYDGKLQGTWYRNALGSPATMELTPISPQRIQFRIDASSGAHIGEIEGFFTIESGRGTFEAGDTELGACKLTFDGTVEQSIRIEQEGCAGYLGAGVAFIGLYDRTRLPLADLAMAELTERFGPDAAKALAELAGPEFESVAQSIHLNDENLEGPEPSETATYAVRGLYGSMMTCFSVNRQTGQVWLAYIDDDTLRVLGPRDGAPEAFTKWVDRISADYELKLAYRSDNLQ